MGLNNIKLLDILTTLLNDDYKNYQDQWHEFDCHTYFKFVDKQLLLTIPFYFNNSLFPHYFDLLVLICLKTLLQLLLL